MDALVLCRYRTASRTPAPCPRPTVFLPTASFFQGPSAPRCCDEDSPLLRERAESGVCDGFGGPQAYEGVVRRRMPVGWNRHGAQGKVNVLCALIAISVEGLTCR